MEQKLRRVYFGPRTAHPFKPFVFNRAIKSGLQKLPKPWNRLRRVIKLHFAKNVRGSFSVILFLIFAVSSFTFAQEKPKAKLVIEFSKATCDDLIAYVDLLARPLNQDPSSKGLAIFYPRLENPSSVLGFEDFFLWSQPRFGSNRPRIVQGKPRGESKVELWVIPSGADEPKYDAAGQGEMFANVSKPFLYNTEFGGEMCPAANPRLIGDLMAFNSNVDLRIVVRGKTSRYRTRKAHEWLRRLVDQEKIPRQRIRVILSGKLEPDYPYQDVEFWFVPVSRN